MTKIAASLPDELVLPARAAPEKGRFASVPAQYVLGPGEPERAVWRRVIVAVRSTPLTRGARYVPATIYRKIRECGHRRPAEC